MGSPSANPGLLQRQPDSDVTANANRVEDEDEISSGDRKVSAPVSFRSTEVKQRVGRPLCGSDDEVSVGRDCAPSASPEEVQGNRMGDVYQKLHLREKSHLDSSSTDSSDTEDSTQLTQSVVGLQMLSWVRAS